MKWFGIILVLLSTLGVSAIFGFTLFSIFIGISGGLITTFAIGGYLKSVQNDYQDEDIKY
ncbi:hypothetical protein [Paenibacillus sp. FSL M7-1046]|uniref:hypothetical protein n=1 Tax=Paenibacillus sp. FSL M7-1046 TaxID=2975315 RepID=UPI0030F71587